MISNGDIVKINHPGLVGKYEWTVLDCEENLLGCTSFTGHSGVRHEYIGTVWEGHCYYIPKELWEGQAILIEENE